MSDKIKMSVVIREQSEQSQMFVTSIAKDIIAEMESSGGVQNGLKLFLGGQLNKYGVVNEEQQSEIFKFILSSLLLLYNTDFVLSKFDVKFSSYSVSLVFKQL